LLAAGLAIGLAFYAGGAADTYSQPDMRLRCGACGNEETLSVEQYAARMEAELPGGAAFIEGPELICRKCGKKAVRRVQEPLVTGQPGPPAAAPQK
jgi:hypothetical protein